MSEKVASRKPIGGVVLLGDRRALRLDEITAPLVYGLTTIKEIPEDYALKLPNAHGDIKHLIPLKHIHCVEFYYDYDYPRKCAAHSSREGGISDVIDTQ